MYVHHDGIIRKFDGINFLAFLLSGESCQNCRRDDHEDCPGGQARAPAEKGLLTSLLLKW